MSQLRSSQFRSSWISARLVASTLGMAALAACGSGNGDEVLRPRLLTPSINQAVEQPPPTEVTQQMPDPSLPPPTPPGTPDEEGYISGPPQECNGPALAMGTFGTPAPTDGTMVSFDTYLTTGMWGNPSIGQITGGTSLYSSSDPANAITRMAADGTLQMTASITPGGYSGIVFWYGPCVNASPFSGVQFSATGDLGGASMIVKAQTSPDYPIDIPNTKGKCKFRVDANKFTECVQPNITVASLATSPVTLPWSSFTGGVPSASVDTAQLLGFELQFQCPSAATANCALNLNLGTISFTM